MKRLFILWLLCSVYPAYSEYKYLITQLSNPIISVNSQFSGQTVTVYGMTNKSANLLIRVLGKRKNMLIDHYKRSMGIWYKASSRKIYQFPSYYAYGSTQPYYYLTPLYQLQGWIMIHANNENQVRNLWLFRRLLRKEKRFEAGFITVKAVGKMQLFNFTIFIPDVVPPGDYQVQINAFYPDNTSIQMVRIFYIIPQGFWATMRQMHRLQPALYTFFVVLMAIGIGFFTSGTYTLLKSVRFSSHKKKRENEAS